MAVSKFLLIGAVLAAGVILATGPALLDAQTRGPIAAPGRTPLPSSRPAEPEPEIYDADEAAIISVDVSLVNVMATVRGKKGELLGNLEQSDFRIFEDGKEQEIRYFERQTELPLTIGLLVDVSQSQERLIDVERRAAGRFFEEVLRPTDLAFIISFGKDSELLQDLTSSGRLLQDGLNDLRLNAATQVTNLPGPVPTMNRAAGTVLYDAVFLAADERLRQEAGRKVMVVITDGMDYGSKVDRDEAIRAAHRADTAIYSIYYADRNYGGSDRDLKRMAEETGGRVYSVNRPQDLERVFQEIQQEMRSQYAVGFAPDNAQQDGSFREIEFKMSNKDYKVQARKGYYATGARN